MRFATLLVVFACGCATSSSSGPPSGGTPEPADAKERGWRSPVSEDGGAAAAAAPGAADGGPVSVAVATLEPKSGSKVTGTARVTPSASGVVVLVTVQDAAPGEHGVHIHEKGDCSDPAAMNAGGHFNPNSGAHHGGPNTPVRHGGDLGNMTVNSLGGGLLVVAVSDLTVENVVGRSVVVHEKADDLQTDPAGNSGARIACGVLQEQ
jgi:Cu-Zn family superoxide dismutase